MKYSVRSGGMDRVVEATSPDEAAAFAIRDEGASERPALELGMVCAVRREGHRRGVVYVLTEIALSHPSLTAKAATDA